MSIKVRVFTCFQLYSQDLRFFTPEAYYDVEIPKWSSFAVLRLKLFQTWPISSQRYKIEFSRDWFDEGTLYDGNNVLEDDKNVDDGVTVFAVINFIYNR